jgi:NADH-quinone oxidoreductase subunit H
MQCTDILNTTAACLTAGGMNPGLAQFLAILLGVLVVTLAPLLIVIGLIWVERKFAARVQDRIGPNRVGPFGLLQTVADALKLITKEDITPAGADRVIYNLAPVISVLSVILMWAVIPVSPYHVGVELSIGVLYIVAVGSVGTLAIMMAGWSSNNKYALLGAFRVVAQLVSYEVPMILALLVPVLLAGSMNMQDIVRAQAGMWFAVLSPVGLFLLFISTQAETGRAPFDLIEAESELVAGYNIEYSGMKFGLFFAGEFLHVMTNGLLIATLFMGGWLGPFSDQAPLLGVVWLFAKASIFYLVSLLLRSALPRVRIDQMMAFNWKFLVPLAVWNVLVTAGLWMIARNLIPDGSESDLLANLPAALIMLVGNIVFVGGFVLNRVRAMGRRERFEDMAKAAKTRGMVVTTTDKSLTANATVGR